MTVRSTSLGAGAKDFGSVRRLGFLALVTAGVLLLFAANIFLWLQLSIYNSGRFTSNLSKVLDEPAVQRRIANVLATQVTDSSDLQTRVRQELPAPVVFLAPIVDSQLDPLLAQVIERILASDLDGELRGRVIVAFHQRLIAVLEGNSGLQVQGDRLELDFSEVLARVFDRLGVAQPQRLKDTDKGTVVIVDNAKNLERASFLVRNRQALTLFSLLGSVVAFASATWIATNRRSACRTSGYAVLGVGLTSLLLVVGGRIALASLGGEHIVAKELYRQFTKSLQWQSLLLVVLGGCIVALADPRVFTGLGRLKDRGVRTVEDFGLGRSVLIAAAVLGIALLLV